MKRLILMSLIFEMIFIIGGCVPKRVVWSPDGQKAIVLGEDGVYLADTQGHFTKALAYSKTSSQPTTSPVTNIESLDSAAWMPDSKHVIFTVKRNAHSWSDIASISQVDEKQFADRLAKLEQELSTSTDIKKTLSNVDVGTTTDWERTLLRFYITKQLSPDLQKKIGPTWKDFKNEDLEVSLLERYTLENSSFCSPVILARSLREIMYEACPSPDGHYIAYVEDKEDQSLMLVPADGSAKPQLLENAVSWYPDWSPDSRSLVYIKKMSKTQSVSLGTLTRRQIRNDSGQLLSEPDVKDLAGLLYDGALKVRCLSDGRILFICSNISLPCTPAQMPKQPKLFILDHARYPGVIPAIPTQSELAINDGLIWFEPSPDGRFISIPSQYGSLNVLELSTGNVTEVQPMEEIGDKKDDITLRTVPVWRNKDELCFAVPPGSPMGSPKRAEIVLYSMKDKKARCISKTWPDAAIKNFLTKKIIV